MNQIYNTGNPNGKVVAEFNLTNISGDLQVSERLFHPFALNTLFLITFFNFLPSAFFLAEQRGRMALYKLMTQLQENDKFDIKLFLELKLPNVKNYHIVLYQIPNGVYRALPKVGFFTASKLGEQGTVTIFCYFIAYLFNKVKNNQIVVDFLSQVLLGSGLEEFIKEEFFSPTGETTSPEIYNIIAPISAKFSSSLYNK